MKRISMESTYNVKDEDVFLSVIIGNAQIGQSVIMLGDTEIARGEINKVKIGSGAELAGKRLTVKTVVTDVNDSTNLTNVIFRFSGGKAFQEFNLTATVDQNGDSVIYRGIIDFKM